MKKTKLITDHPEYWLLIRDELNVKQDDWIYDSKGQITLLTQEEYETYGDLLNTKGCISCWKILGHLPKDNAPILEGVPLLPVITGGREEGINREEPWIRQTLRGINSPAANNKLKIELLEGLWEAASIGMYTEEDMKKAFEAGAISLGRNTEIGITKDGYEKIYDKEAVELEMHKWIKSYQPSPAIPTPIDFIVQWESVKSGATGLDLGSPAKDYSWKEQIKTIPNEQNIPTIQGQWIFK